MPVVSGLSVYLGKSPAAKNAALGQNLCLDDGGWLCQQFRRSLLDSQDGPQRFNVTVAIPELPPVDVRFAWIGNTAGVALWERAKTVGAATVYLSGVECDRECEGARGFLVANNLTVPEAIWTELVTGKKAGYLSLYYDLYTYTDPVVASAAPALANSLFSLCGTNEEV